MNLPNRLTMIRIVLVPLIVLIYIFPYAQFGIYLGYINIGFVALPVKNIIILALFAIASFTDFLDGYIARKYNMVTTFGKFMDPIADKLLVNSLFILLAVDGIVPVVPVLVMIWRDSIVDAVRMMASGKGRVMSAGMLGKLKTLLQMFTIIFVLLCNLPFELYELPFTTLLLWSATFISVAGGISYFLQAKDIILESK